MDEFLKACGAAGPLDLRIDSRGQAATRWSALQPFALIGSDPAADLTLDDSRVDRLHTYLQVIAGEVYWIDLGSQSGTRGESSRAPSGWLLHPHGIGIGPYLIQLAGEDREAVDSSLRRFVRPDPFATLPQDIDDLPRVVLEFRRDSARPIRWRMRHILTLVGSSSACKVRLAAPGVSPFHCSLLRTALGVWVVNLGQGGIAVNGASIRVARLSDGDELQIGNVVVQLFFKTSPPTNGKIRSSIVDSIDPVALVAHMASPSRELATSRPPSAWRAPSREAARILAERASSEGELSASLLTSVFDQFDQMQQQFLDQFQQSAVMMFRALGAMHRDQMEELREKLDSLDQITEDFKALQAQMASTVPSGPHPPVPGAAEPVPPQPGTPRTPAGETGSGGQDRSSTENGTEHRKEKLRSLVDQPNDLSMNVHEWMIGRLAALEDERRSRWQKILDLMRGR